MFVYLKKIIIYLKKKKKNKSLHHSVLPIRYLWLLSPDSGKNGGKMGFNLVRASPGLRIALPPGAESFPQEEGKQRADTEKGREGQLKWAIQRGRIQHFPKPFLIACFSHLCRGVVSDWPYQKASGFPFFAFRTWVSPSCPLVSACRQDWPRLQADTDCPMGLSTYPTGQ